MTDPRGATGGGLPIGTLLALGVCGFGALVVCAFGFASLWTDEDVVATPDVPIIAGVGAVFVALAAFALVLWPALRVRHPRFTAVVPVTIAAAAAYAASLWLLSLVFGADVVTATAAVGRIVIGWPVPVLAVAAAVSAWATIAVRRTRARPPQWPWERRQDDE